jgi:DNA-binding response OmpR family regulator
MSTVDKAFDSALASLRERYLSGLSNQIAELRKFAVLCEFGEANSDVRAAIGQLAHRLGGTGETLGFPEISTAAASLAQTLECDALAAGTATAARTLARACEAATGLPLDAKGATEPGPPPIFAEAAEALPPILPHFVAIFADPTLAGLLGDVCANRAHVTSLTACTEGIAFLNNNRADLVILDLDCPGCPTEDVAALHRKARALNIPVVATASQRRSATILHALSEGGIECLLKPIEAALLHKKLFETLERQRLIAIVCDDDPVIREFLKPRFEARGFQVILTKDGEELLDLAIRVRPSIIVLDRIMPGMDGLDVLRSLKSKSETHAIPVIVLTSKTQQQYIAEGMRSGAAAYLAKPFSPDQVVGKCVEVLGLAKPQRL